MQAAVAANVLAPPSLTLEQVLELQDVYSSRQHQQPLLVFHCNEQEAEIAEYSKTTFQTLKCRLYATDVSSRA